LAQGFLDVLGAGSFDGLVDRECLAQMRAAFTAVAVLEVAVADSFQGASFLEGCPQLNWGFTHNKRRNFGLTSRTRRPAAHIVAPRADSLAPGKKADVQVALRR